MAFSDKPIFVMGTERSGTNLVRKLISMNEEIKNIPPIHAFHDLYDITPFYGGLEKEDNFRKLVENFLELKDQSFSEWDSSINFEKMYSNLDERSFLSIYDFVHYSESSVDNLDRWVTKDVEIHNYVYPIYTYYENPKFVWVVRDPRDVVLSMLKKPDHSFSVYYAAHRWLKEQKKILSLTNDRDLSANIHKVRYRDLLNNPERTMEGLCEFLDLEYEDSMLKPERIEKDSNGSIYWENLSRPLMRNNYDKYEQGLSDRQIRIIETVCRPYMNFLGFNTVTKEDIGIGVLRKIFYKLYNFLNSKFLNGYHKRKGFDQDEVNRREKRNEVRSKIKSQVKSKYR